MTYDPRYFTTYYALDAINFKPKDVSSALDRLDAPYLPLVVQEAAGLPLDPSFAEQKKILERCQRPVLPMRRRRRGPALQPAADRRRVDQGNGVPLVCERAGARPARGQHE